MEQLLKTYTVHFQKAKLVWEFKYDLNGNLKTFNIVEGVLTNKLMIWLFKGGNFPAIESVITTTWIPNLSKDLKISIGEPDLSFDNFWDIYANKVGKRKMAEGLWTRLTKANKMLVFLNIPKYKNYLKHYPSQQMMYPTTYLNQEAYLNEWKIN